MLYVLVSVLLGALWATAPLASATNACFQAPSASPLKTLTNFPKGTWAENLHLRHDGSVLVTLYEGGPGQIVLITPPPGNSKHSRTAQSNSLWEMHVVHRFQNTSIGASGVVELEQDVFYFNTFHRGSLALNPPPGTGQVWSVDLRAFNGTEVPVKLVANLTESIFPNGLTATQHDPRKLLVADSQRGVVWRVDPEMGSYDISASDPLLTYAESTIPLGINGIHAKNNFVYFTNTQQNLFARYLISTSGLRTGEIEVIKNLDPSLLGVDDFTVFPGSTNAVLLADDIQNGTFFQYQDCTKRIATTNGTTANRVAWSQMKSDGSVPVFVTSEGGVQAYERPGPIEVGGALSVFEMTLGEGWHDLVKEARDGKVWRGTDCQLDSGMQYLFEGFGERFDG